MSLNDTASSQRLHIGFFGLRNCGKSSLVNAVTGQNLSLVSDVKGTTTDPVRKTMELLPLGPVVIIDTPGIDDTGVLGALRVQKTMEVLRIIDIAVLVADATKGLQKADRDLIGMFQERDINYLIAYNKADLQKEAPGDTDTDSNQPAIYVSALLGTNIRELKERIGSLAKDSHPAEKPIVSDLLSPNDLAVLVVPIDSAAPKGRLILPQQQTIRDILEAGAISIVTKETSLKETLASLEKKPRIVITDSQAFGKVAKDTPEDIPLTSFSILFARYKGNLSDSVRGAAQLSRLKDGDTVLISEGCTHHRQCDDIGTVKLPAWIREYAKKDIRFSFTSGREFPDDLSSYALVIHCGGCMLNEREMRYRAGHAKAQKVPMTNYGVAIAQMHGILKRSLGPFPGLADLLP